MDGIVGKITRAKIKELEDGFFGERVHPTTRLNCRRGASATYAVKKVLGTSYVDTVDKVKGNWVHLKKANGWVNKKYLAIAD